MTIQKSTAASCQQEIRQLTHSEVDHIAGAGLLDMARAAAKVINEIVRVASGRPQV